MRSLLAFLLLAGIVYAGICALLWVRQRDLIYLPAYTRVPVEATDFALRRPDALLRGWVVNPGERRALLYFGGNAEAIEHNRAELGRALPAHTVYLLAYRGYGASEGSPGEAALLADAVALYDAVATRHESIDVMGRSLGSGVALHVASQREVSRVVVVTPYDSLLALGQSLYPWLPVTWLLQDRYESVRIAPRIEAPVLMITAGQDRIMPAARSDALAAAFAVPPQQVRIDAAGHNDVHLDRRYLQALNDFLSR